MRKKIRIAIVILLVIVLVKMLPGIVQFSQVSFQLLFNRNIELRKTNSHVNVLLLGIAGGKHEGPNLTDTIIFSSIDQKKNRVTLVSIPRDLWISDLEAKINTAYAIGESKRKDGGLVLTKAVVSKVVNRSVDYVFRIDFEGFVRAVDLVGGLDIAVDSAFDDYEYPLEEKREDLCGHSLEAATEQIATQSGTIVFPCRYTHIHFDKGAQHMDGARTLVFVRSRNAEGHEGTDFARSMRQQKVIKAFRDKILSPGTLLNPIKLASLYTVLSQSIHTDIQSSEFDDFIKLGEKLKKATIISTVIEEEDKEQNKKGLLTHPPLTDFGGSWVLIPKAGDGNFSHIHRFVTCVLTTDSCPIE